MMPASDDVVARVTLAAAAIHKLTCQADKPEDCEGPAGRDFDLAAAALAAAGQVALPGPGAAMIASERARQVSGEGYTARHDQAHRSYELSRAAAVYALCCCPASSVWPAGQFWPAGWRFNPAGNPVRTLAKAGALIAAEIDRLLGQETQAPDAGPVDIGYLSLPAEVQEAAEAHLAEKPGGSLNPTPDCGYRRRNPPPAGEPWWCAAHREFHQPARTEGTGV